MQRMVLRLTIYLGCAMFFCSTACPAADAPQVKSDNRMTYAERVVAIDRGVGDLYTKDALLGYAPFTELASEAVKNIDACIQFLGTEGHSYQQRMIAILSMHGLGLRDDIDFLQRMVSLFDRRLVSRDEVSLAVLPTYSFSTLLIENYDHEDVRRVLGEIATKDVRPSTRSAIEGILSGHALEQMKAFRRNCCSAQGSK
jgi:hypothetical protein